VEAQTEERSCVQRQQRWSLTGWNYTFKPVCVCICMLASHLPQKKKVCHSVPLPIYLSWKLSAWIWLAMRMSKTPPTVACVKLSLYHIKQDVDLVQYELDFLPISRCEIDFHYINYYYYIPFARLSKIVPHFPVPWIYVKLSPLKADWQFLGSRKLIALNYLTANRQILESNVVDAIVVRNGRPTDTGAAYNKLKFFRQEYPAFHQFWLKLKTGLILSSNYVVVFIYIYFFLCLLSSLELSSHNQVNYYAKIFNPITRHCQ
jgi:hypothetical protein